MNKFYTKKNGNFVNQTTSIKVGDKVYGTMAGVELLLQGFRIQGAKSLTELLTEKTRDKLVNIYSLGNNNAMIFDNKDVFDENDVNMSTRRHAWYLYTNNVYVT